MKGSIIKRVQHSCIDENGDEKGRWVQLPAARQKRNEKLPPCKHCGKDVTEGLKRYDCTWRAGDKQLRKTFNNAKQAEIFLTNTVKQVQDGNFTATRPEMMSVVFDEWLKSMEVKEKQGRLRPSTTSVYRSMVAKHLRPEFENYRSDRLSHDAIRAWTAKCADLLAEGDLSPKYFNNLLALLGVILRWARGRGQRYLAHDPLEETDATPRVRSEARFLEPAQWKALIEEAEAPDDTLILLAVFSGVRRGELFELKWTDLDEDGCKLHVQRSRYHGKVTAPKTGSSTRRIDLPLTLVQRLQSYREVFPPLKGNYIFRTETGSPLDPDNWMKRSFKKIAQRAGLLPKEGEVIEQEEEDGIDAKRLGLHTLRHTYASILINQGENIKYVSKQLGHASIEITVNTYGHLFKETSVSAMNRLAMRMPVAKPKREEEGEAVA